MTPPRRALPGASGLAALPNDWALPVAGARTASPAGAPAGERALRYGISMADIPLTTGQPDLIGTPALDMVPRLRAAGNRVVENVTPHVRNCHPSMLEGSPWRDLRLRQAAQPRRRGDAAGRAGRAGDGGGGPGLAAVRRGRPSGCATTPTGRGVRGCVQAQRWFRGLATLA